MTSGVKVSDDVVALYNDMKLRKCPKKAVLFCLSDDEKRIIEETKKHILHDETDCETPDPFDRFVKLLPKNDCRYAIYDASFETEESKKQDLVFILWAPETAKIKYRMIYASTKEAMKKALTGIKHEWQVNGQDELERCTLADKLRGQGCPLVSLEGKPF